MADDAISKKTPRWGGPRIPAWDQPGGIRRAVVPIDGEVYQFIPLLAQLSRRSVKDLTVQIFLAGMESLLGQSLRTLEEAEFVVNMRVKCAKPKDRPWTHDEVRALARAAFEFDEESAGA